MAVDFFCFDGIAISSARAIAYAKTIGSAGGIFWKDCETCGEDFYLIDNEGVPYTDPETDEVPWYSAKEPESADWFGLVITGIEGLDFAPTLRGVTDRINDGGQFARQRRGPREVRVTAVSLGRTCTAAWWGARWLNEQLREPSCGAGCGGVDLEYFLNCPDFKGSCIVPNVPSALDTAIAPYKRTLYNVALTEGVLLEDQIHLARCCKGDCSLPIIQFVFTAADPWAFTVPTVAVEGGTVFPCAGSGTCPTWTIVADDEIPADPCAETPACEGDAICGVVASPPDPPVLRDPCVCDPITLATTCFDLDAEDFSDLGQTVPIFTIKAGTDALRGLSVRFIPRDTGRPLNPCDTCFEINLPFLNANSTWTFDAARRETMITCGGQTNSATVTGDDGGPLAWPVFECVPTDYAMCVTLACGADVTDVEVNISLVTRHG